MKEIRIGLRVPEGHPWATTLPAVIQVLVTDDRQLPLTDFTVINAPLVHDYGRDGDLPSYYWVVLPL